MQEPYAAQQVYADLAHEADLHFRGMLRALGCTCHPHLAVAVVVRPNYCAALHGEWEEEPVPVVKFLAHEPGCWYFAYGREN